MACGICECHRHHSDGVLDARVVVLFALQGAFQFVACTISAYNSQLRLLSSTSSCSDGDNNPMLPIRPKRI